MIEGLGVELRPKSAGALRVIAQGCRPEMEGGPAATIFVIIISSADFQLIGSGINCCQIIDIITVKAPRLSI